MSPATTYDGRGGLMNEQAGPEVEPLTIRILMRLQRRGGRKLTITPEGATAAPQKPTATRSLIKTTDPGAPLAAQNRERAGAGESIVPKPGAPQEKRRSRALASSAAP
jgi:hypothetical protein